MIRLLKLKALLVQVSVLSLLCFTISCSKGFKDYYNEGNTKGGFLYDKIKSDPQFSTFATALERANIVQFISEGGLYTVFAPTNEAFTKYLSNNGYTSVNDVPVDKLYNILSFHIVHNMWYYYDFRSRFATFQQRLYLTRNRKFVNVDITTPDVIKVNDIPVITSLRDIDANNGVIHGIGEVLVPLPNLEEIFQSDPDLANSTFYKLMQVIKDSAYDRFNSFDRNRDGVIDSIFVKTYSALFGNTTYSTTLDYRANTAATSQGGDPIFTTFLVPSNAALDAFLAPALAKVNNKIDSLSPSYVEAVLESYAIMDTAMTSAQLVARAAPSTLKSINGELVPILTAGQFIKKDLRGSNGYIHMINTTFPITPTSILNSALGKLFIEPEYSMFVAAIKKASLQGVWAVTTKTGTIFAPTNNAFTEIGFDVQKGTLNGAVLTTTGLSNIVRNHFITENLTKANLTGTPSVSKNSDVGAAQPLIFTNAGTTVTTNSGVVATVTYPEIAKGPGNPAVGYVYKVDKVLLPKQ